MLVQGTLGSWTLKLQLIILALLAQPAKTGFVQAAVFVLYDDRGEPSSVLTTDSSGCCITVECLKCD